ncbi:Peptidase inhibitor R3HDML, partial [Anas platyrhynchos]
LARAAEAWAVQCVWEHGPPQLMKYVGQNLSIPLGQVRAPRGAPGSWLPALGARWGLDLPSHCFWPGEQWFLQRGVPPTPARSAGSLCSADHPLSVLAQMVWASSNRLGCAIHACSNVRVWGSTWRRAVLLVCNYAIKGNWIGEAPYKVGRPCSACPPSYGGVCSNNMCFTGLKSNQVGWL